MTEASVRQAGGEGGGKFAEPGREALRNVEVQVVRSDSESERVEVGESDQIRRGGGDGCCGDVWTASR